MSKLKFRRHQNCIFNFNKLIREYLHDLRIEPTKIIKNTYDNPSQKFINDEIEKKLLKMKKIKKVPLEILYYLSKERTYSKASSYVKLIKSN